jgi:TonB family protein
MNLPSLRSLRCGLLLALLAPAVAPVIHAETAAAVKFDTPPRPLKTRAPEYPADLRDQGVSGAVSVLVDIDESGKVVNAEVSKASNDRFRAPAVDAVRQWVFTPAKLAGKAVPARVTIPLVFSLEG